jgi:uncharacterized protein YkwD
MARPGARVRLPHVLGPWKPALLLAVAIAAAATFATTATRARADGAPCPNAEANIAGLAIPDFEAAVLCELNQRRAENGLAPLRSNDLLHDAAYVYATSMLAGRFYDHYGDFVGNDSRSNVIRRLRFFGYIRPHWSWIVGEVLRGAHPDTSTPKLVVDAWMASPLHRVEVLKPRFRDVGVAAVHGVTDNFPSTDGVTVDVELGFREPKRK